MNPPCKCCEREREKEGKRPLPLKLMASDLITEALDEHGKPLFRNHDLPYYLCEDCDSEALALILGR